MSTRIVSPERQWRALSAPVIAAVLGWVLASSFHRGLRSGASPGLPLAAKIIVTCVATVIGVALATLIMGTHLTVGTDGLSDRRLFRVVRIPWEHISRFEIGRPGSLWGGFCVQAVCRDGATIDLMSTRAYSRIPSARHVSDLDRIRSDLDQAATGRI